MRRSAPRDLLWERYQGRVLSKAVAFARVAAREQLTPHDLCQMAYLKFFADKARDAEDPEVRRKGEASIRRYNPLYAGDGKTGAPSRGFATLATFVDNVLRNYFIQEMRRSRHSSGMGGAGRSKHQPGESQPAATPSHAQSVEKALDRIMQHPKFGIRKSCRELRTFLQNQSEESLRRAIADDSELALLMKLLPQPVPRTIPLLDHDHDTCAGRRGKSEYDASARYNRDRSHSQRNAETREILDHILACLRDEKIPPGRRARGAARQRPGLRTLLVG